MKPRSVPILLFLLLFVSGLTFAQGGRMAQQAPSGADKARLAKLEKEYSTAKTALSKRPKDKKAQERFTAIGALYGHESMMSPVLPPRVKYRQALHIYREVLKVDPANKVAKGDSDMIISIYKSMGRPVPND